MDRRAGVGRFVVGIACLASVSAVAWLVLLAVVPGLLGWRTMTLTSGSMSPALKTGDIVVSKPYRGGTLRTGAVISFRDPAGGKVITHRVVGRGAGDDYVTKGDANPFADSTPVPARNVVGVGRWVVPRVGMPAVWMRAGNWSDFLSVAVVLGAALWYSRFAIHPRHDPWRTERTRAPWTRPRRAVSVLLALSLVEVAAGSTAVVVRAASRAAYSAPVSNGLNSFAAAEYTQRYLKSAPPTEGGGISPVLPFSAVGVAPTAGSLPNYDPGENDDPGQTIVEGSDFQAWYVQSPASGAPLAVSGSTRLRLWTAMAGFDTTRAGSLTAKLYDCETFEAAPHVGCTVLGTATVTSTGSWTGGNTGWVQKMWDFGTLSHTVPGGQYLVLVLTVPTQSGSRVMVAYDTTAYRSALQVG